MKVIIFEARGHANVYAPLLFVGSAIIFVRARLRRL